MNVADPAFADGVVLAAPVADLEHALTQRSAAVLLHSALLSIMSA